MTLTVATLRQVVRLDPETGLLSWLPRPRDMFTTQRAFSAWNARFPGNPALCQRDRGGYMRGKILNRMHSAARVVFALHYGRWPDLEVDHRDGDRGNNRPGNLREATRKQQCQNLSGRGGSSQYKGVSWCNTRKRWVAASINGSGRKKFIGYFTDEDAAARAYDAFARQEQGEFARPNFPQECRESL